MQSTLRLDFTDCPSNAASSPRNDSLLRTTLALQHLAHVRLAVQASNQINTPPLTQCTVKTGISMYRPRRSSNAASSPRNDSLVRTALALQQLAYVRLAVRASYQIDTPPVNPTNCQNRDIDSNDSTDLSYPQRSPSCIPRLDHTSYRHHPSSWRPHTTATNFTYAFVNLTINRHFCCICYLAFVPFIVFGCHYSHTLNPLIGSATDIHLRGGSGGGLLEVHLKKQ